MRVAMLKKTSDDAKKTRRFFHWFFINFSRKIDGKSCKKRGNQTGVVHKNRRESTFGTPFFSKKSIFSKFLGSPRVPRAVPGRPGKFTKSLIFLIHGELRPKTSPGGLREASGRPRRSPQAPSGYDFASIFGSILHVKNKRKHTKSVENNSKNLEELVTLIRATVNSW